MIKIICGPTASGKTDLALRLAEVSTKAGRPASIISADSRQIYQGLDIITGKDIPKGFIKKESNLLFNNRKVVYYTHSVIPSEVEGSIRLWGLDLLSPDEVYNAAGFSMLSRRIIAEESKQERGVFIVGGTGFYLKSLTQPESLAKIPPNETLRKHLEKLSLEKLQQKLKNLNPKRLASMNQSDVNNPRRLIRALEIASSLSLRGASPRSNPSGSPRSARDDTLSFSWIGLRVPLEIIRERIKSRVLSRLDLGAIEEVKTLLEKYPNQALPIYTTLGIKPIIRFLNRGIDLPTLINTWVIDEMNYAKRQITWFKKQPDILWYDQT